MQSTSHLLMIKPVNFGFNAETAVNNSFQSKVAGTGIQLLALKEFENLVALLRNNDIDVTVIEDTYDPHTPDSIFPNNWISFHENGRAYLYPMFAVNRRQERKQHVIDTIGKRFLLDEIVDLTGNELNNRFLEGTGSMVLDRDNKIAYSCLSPRTDKDVLQDFCRREGYRPFSFTATDKNGDAIYHTNVMMCVADRYAVVCLESISDGTEREQLRTSLLGTGKELIPITMDQMAHFAGNMLQVQNRNGKSLLVMSSQAYNSLSAEQLAAIEKYDPIVHSDITAIETNGGGSARCMIAEVFLSPNER